MQLQPTPVVVGTPPAPVHRARGPRRAVRHVAGLLVATLVAVGLAVATPHVPPAAADTKPTEPGNPVTVAADGLPTAQINGVAYSQVIAGGKVYVAGSFSTARPAGAAPGVSTTPRANLLAYDLATGALTPWAPKLNGTAYAIAVSPDGTKIYVGGDFTTVNGVAQAKFAVLDRLTGARVAASSGPKPNGAVKALAVTGSTVYLGGLFNAVGTATRKRLAAVNATTGALLPWTVTADLNVEAMTMSPDKTRVIVGGRFSQLNGVQARGSGAVSAATGTVQPWAANKLITQYGYDAGITSLSTDGSLVYGSGFAYLQGTNGYGNLEGVFAADPATGAVRWVEDCHGDTYSVYPNPGKDHIYTVGHAHFCANIGSFGETAWRTAVAFTKQAVMTITPNSIPDYYNFAGQRAPRLLHWFPDLNRGATTAAKQASWHVTGTGDWVVLAGEFTTVNGRPQQGLVRMTTSAAAPDKQGPLLSGTSFQPVATSEAAGTAQVSWPTNWDRDNARLTYRVYRNGTTLVHTTAGTSNFYERPRLSFTDTGLAAGTTYRYKVVVDDGFGNTVTSPEVSVVAAAATKGAASTYAREVLGDNPEGYWRLGEASGAAQDWTGYADLTVGTAAGRAVAGAIAGDANKAVRTNGTSGARIYGGKQSTGGNRLSVEAWFRTSSTAGGKIVGYGSSSTATNSTAYDRHLYIGSDGRLSFGVNPNSRRVVTAPTAVNDGRWHHAVGTLSPTGMRLYVDGVLRAERTDTVSAQVTKGYWHIGGDAVAGWPAASGQNFVGDVDDVAVYGRALTATEVASHRSIGIGGSTAAAASPTPSATTASPAPSATTASSAPTAGAEADTAAGTGTTGTGTTGTGTTGTGTGTTVPAPTTLAGDAFGRTVSGWGSADLGGAWTTTSGVASVSGGQGLLALTTGGASASARLPGVTGTTLTTRATASWDTRPAGGGGWWMVRGRITSAGEYRLKIGHRATGAVTARLVRSAADGTETVLGTEVTVPGLTYAAGTGVVGELELVGTAPTTLRARVWAAGAARPSAALLTASDSATGLQAAGHTGLAALLSTTTTNVPVTVRVDDYSVVRPG